MFHALLETVDEISRRRALHFVWLRPGEVALSAAPKPDDIELLKKWGIKAVLTVRETPLPDYQGLDHFHLEAPDGGVPKISRAKQALRWMVEKVVKEHRPVLIHCQRGYGRTGLLAALYLRYTEKMDGKRARGGVVSKLRLNVMKPEQVKFLDNFAL